MLPLNVVTTGLLPPALREQYRLPWGPWERRLYGLAVAARPEIIAITPPLIRVWPRRGPSVGLTASGRAATSWWRPSPGLSDADAFRGRIRSARPAPCG